MKMRPLLVSAIFLLQICTFCGAISSFLGDDENHWELVFGGNAETNSFKYNFCFYDKNSSSTKCTGTGVISLQSACNCRLKLVTGDAENSTNFDVTCDANRDSTNIKDTCPQSLNLKYKQRSGWHPIDTNPPPLLKSGFVSTADADPSTCGDRGTSWTVIILSFFLSISVILNLYFKKDALVALWEWIKNVFCGPNKNNDPERENGQPLSTVITEGKEGFDRVKKSDVHHVDHDKLGTTKQQENPNVQPQVKLPGRWLANKGQRYLDMSEKGEQ